MNFWQGDKIRVRAVEPSDWEHFYFCNLVSERGAHLDFLWPPISKDLVKKDTERDSLYRMENDIFKGVIENLKGEIVGSIGTHHIDRRVGVFSYGLAIDHLHQRKGYATEAILLVIKYYFEELRYQKCNVKVHSNNASSIVLHEKLGFKQEGRIRNTVFTQGTYFDSLWYGLTLEEWKQRGITQS